MVKSDSDQEEYPTSHPPDDEITDESEADPRTCEEQNHRRRALSIEVKRLTNQVAIINANIQAKNDINMNSDRKWAEMVDVLLRTDSKHQLRELTTFATAQRDGPPPLEPSTAPPSETEADAEEIFPTKWMQGNFWSPLSPNSSLSTNTTTRGSAAARMGEALISTIKNVAGPETTLMTTLRCLCTTSSTSTRNCNLPVMHLDAVMTSCWSYSSDDLRLLRH
jgi:hypothetical protein